MSDDLVGGLGEAGDDGEGLGLDVEGDVVGGAPQGNLRVIEVSILKLGYNCSKGVHQNFLLAALR